MDTAIIKKTPLIEGSLYYAKLIDITLSVYKCRTMDVRRQKIKMRFVDNSAETSRKSHLNGFPILDSL